jgi:cyanophycinase
VTGPLALVGGGEWTDGCTFDRELLDVSGADEVVVLPTGSAYEHPDRLVEQATAWFAALGVGVRPVMALTRPDASAPAHVDAVAAARFVYLAGTSPMHLRSVLKDTPLWEALAGAWRGGAALVGSNAGADVLCDPMVDFRGGAFTVGLGLVEGLSVIPRFNTWSHDKVHRTVELAPPGLALVGLPEATAIVRSDDGSWRAEGVGDVVVYRGGVLVGLDALAAQG